MVNIITIKITKEEISLVFDNSSMSEQSHARLNVLLDKIIALSKIIFVKGVE